KPANSSRSTVRKSSIGAACGRSPRWSQRPRPLRTFAALRFSNRSARRSRISPPLRSFTTARSAPALERNSDCSADHEVQAEKHDRDAQDHKIRTELRVIEHDRDDRRRREAERPGARCLDNGERAREYEADRNRREAALDRRLDRRNILALPPA